ncbi:CA174 protein, partial [Bucco capensis]|nr:CA174 protein [Bucco capensis]
SSGQVAGRRPSKRLKWEESSPGKSEREGLETSKPSDGDQLSEDPGGIQQQKSESIPETGEGKGGKEHPASLQPGAVKSSSAPSEGDRDAELHACSEEERSSGSLLSEGSSLEDAELPGQQLDVDSSAFLSEDSNQPLPMARFFGEVEDLPAVAVPSTVMSRREFRKLHFIAKEEEEEED